MVYTHLLVNPSKTLLTIIGKLLAFQSRNLADSPWIKWTKLPSAVMGQIDISWPMHTGLIIAGTVLEKSKERSREAKTDTFFSEHFCSPRPHRQCVVRERGSTTETCTVLPSEWQWAVGGKVWGIGAAEQSVSSPTDLGLTMCVCLHEWAQVRRGEKPSPKISCNEDI